MTDDPSPTACATPAGDVAHLAASSRSPGSWFARLFCSRGRPPAQRVWWPGGPTNLQVDQMPLVHSSNQGPVPAVVACAEHYASADGWSLALGHHGDRSLIVVADPDGLAVAFRVGLSASLRTAVHYLAEELTHIFPGQPAEGCRQHRDCLAVPGYTTSGWDRARALHALVLDLQQQNRDAFACHLPDASGPIQPLRATYEAAQIQWAALRDPQLAWAEAGVRDLSAAATLARARLHPWDAAPWTRAGFSNGSVIAGLITAGWSPEAGKALLHVLLTISRDESPNGNERWRRYARWRWTGEFECLPWAETSLPPKIAVLACAAGLDLREACQEAAALTKEGLRALAALGGAWVPNLDSIK